MGELSASGPQDAGLFLRGLMRSRHIAVETPSRQSQAALTAYPRMHGLGSSLDDVTGLCRQLQAQFGIVRVYSANFRDRQQVMRIDLGLDLCRPTHPRLGSDRFHPINEAWDETEVLADMLFAHPTGRDHPPG
jgi:hypothetical protein